MGRISFNSVQVDSSAINPTIIIQVIWTYQEGLEAPLSLVGTLKADGKKLAKLHWGANPNRNTHQLQFSNGTKANTPTDNRETSVWLTLDAELSSLAIEYIESMRAKSHQNAVRFQCDFQCSSLILGDSYKLSAASGNLSLKQETDNVSFEIAHSDWVNKFAKPLGIGDFLLVELSLLESTKVTEAWKEIYERTYARLQEMDACLKNGDWQKAMYCARQVFENLKVFDDKPEHAALKTDFKDAMQAANHSLDGIHQFEKGIRSFFGYASKFIHDKDSTGRLNPVPVATREDAYFLYSMGLGILNLLGSKLNALDWG